ncbi:MAG: hypothetical protein J07HX5_01855, partial [halophilic archaeon J07HX5]
MSDQSNQPDWPNRATDGGETAADDSRPTADTRSQLNKSAATQSPIEPNSRSRQHWYPAPSISYAIAVVESRRSWRRVRGQDFWLLFVVVGVLAALVSLPVLFGRGQSVGEALAAGGTPPDSVSLVVVAGWLGLFAFGAVAGVGSAGTLDQKPAVLTARPLKDAAGGLLLAATAGYAAFAWLPALVAGSGIAVALGTPAPVVGILAGTTAALLTAVTAGYAGGLALKGLVRRSPWLRRLKPVLGTVVVVGYVWSGTTGRLWAAVSMVSGVLVDSPLGWFADLTFLTTAGMNTSVFLAAAVLLLTAAAVPVCVYATVRAGTYAWSVDATGAETDTSTSGAAPSASPNASAAGDARLNRLLASVVESATRGVAVAVMLRAYRNPLQLFYVALPLVRGPNNRTASHDRNGARLGPLAGGVVWRVGRRRGVPVEPTWEPGRDAPGVADDTDPRTPDRRRPRPCLVGRVCPADCRRWRRGSGTRKSVGGGRWCRRGRVASGARRRCRTRCRNWGSFPPVQFDRPDRDDKGPAAQQDGVRPLLTGRHGLGERDWRRERRAVRALVERRCLGVG